MSRKLIQITLPIFILAFVCTGCGAYLLIPQQTEAVLEDIIAVFGFTMQAVLGVAGVAMIIALVVTLVAYIAFLWYFGRASRAKASQREWDAQRARRDANLNIITAPPGYQVFATELAGELANAFTHKPLHLAAGPINGGPVQFPLEQLQMWALHNLAHSTTRKPDIVNQQPMAPALSAPMSLPEYVDLASHMAHPPSLRSLFLGIGRYPDGQVKPVSAPLGRLVHIAAGGSSGFGKSTFMLALAYQTLNAREAPQLVFLDAKGSTFTAFDGHPHLLYPLASEPADILAVLEALVGEMKRRQKQFAGWRGVADLEQYNKVAAEPLPQIVCYFDEFGLVADHKEIAGKTKRLIQACRSAGISIIAGAQTWKADEISTALRANLSTSVQFYARSKSQSRILLEDSAAASITRPGQAFAVLPGQPGLIELQTPDPKHLVHVTPEIIADGERPEMPVPPDPEDADDEETGLTPQDIEFIDLVRNKISRNEAALKVYNRPYAGDLVYRCKRILGEV